jgi:hypothetical protein
MNQHWKYPEAKLILRGLISLVQNRRGLAREKMIAGLS